MSAEERREEIVEAALKEFAGAGLAGASTEAIARRAGISHAYVFRLFGTKRDLFLAAIDRSYDHILETFRRGAAERDPGDSVFKALGQAYVQLVSDRSEILFQFHAYAACGDEDIRAAVARRYRELFAFVREVSGAEDDVVRLFMATGALIDIATAADLPEASGDFQWFPRMLGRTAR
jgi:AcrR family transcriptional regulator